MAATAASTVQLRKKVYIPINRFKEVDFAKLIYGEGNSTRKRVEDESGCTIALKGRGANKDPALDDPEDLHVLILGDLEEQVRRAENLVRNILSDPALEDSSKVLQHETTLTVRNAQHGFNDPNLETRNIEVKREVVGGIIGKNGEKIRELKDRSGAHVSIEDPPDFSEPMRTVNLRGSKEAVELVETLIREIIAEREDMPPRGRPNGFGGGGPGGLGEGGSRGGWGSGPRSRFEVIVPNEFAGKVIGRRGLTVKGIQDRTRTKIDVPRIPDTSDPRSRTVIVYADSEDDFRAAKAEIEAIVTQGEQETMERGAGPHPGAASSPAGGGYDEMIVTDDQAGLIIGKRGATISMIESRSGAKVQVLTHSESVSPGQRQVIIRGAPTQCAAARQQIEYVMSNGAAGFGATGYGAAYGAAAAPYGGYYGAASPAAAYGQYAGWHAHHQHQSYQPQPPQQAQAQQAHPPQSSASAAQTPQQPQVEQKTPEQKDSTPKAAEAGVSASSGATASNGQTQDMGANGQKYTREQWKAWKAYYAQYGIPMDDEPPAHLLASE